MANKKKKPEAPTLSTDEQDQGTATPEAPETNKPATDQSSTDDPKIDGDNKGSDNNPPEKNESFFDKLEDKFSKVTQKVEEEGENIFGISDQKGAYKLIPDLKVFGHDVWKLISKVSSQSQGWMESTKAMEIPGAGCLVQVTTQKHHHIAEALHFVPGVRIDTQYDKDNNPISRSLVTVPRNR